MEGRHLITSVELSTLLVTSSRHSKGDGGSVPAYRVTASHSCGWRERSERTDAVETLSVVHWQPKKSMGTYPTSLPIVGDTVSMAPVPSERLVECRNTASSTEQQRLWKQRARQCIGVVRVGMTDGHTQPLSGSVVAMHRVEHEYTYVASQVSTSVARNSGDRQDLRARCSCSTLERKLINWLLEYLSRQRSTSRGRVSLSSLSTVYPFLNALDQVDRQVFIERAIQRYAKGRLLLFEGSIIVRGDQAICGSTVQLAGRDEVRAAAAMELCLAGIGTGTRGTTSVASLAEALSVVLRRLLAERKLTKEFEIVAESFAITMQVMSPLLVMISGRGNQWLMPAVRILFGLITERDVTTRHLLSSQLERKRQTFTDDDIWKATLRAMLQRSRVGARGQVGGRVEETPQEFGAADNLPSMLLGNQPSAFFSVLESDGHNGSDSDRSDDDLTGHTPNHAGVHTTISSTAVVPGTTRPFSENVGGLVLLVRDDGAQLRCDVVTSGAPESAVPLSPSNATATRSIPDEVKILSGICRRWLKSGIAVVSPVAQWCGDKAPKDASSIVLTVPTSTTTKSRRRGRSDCDALSSEEEFEITLANSLDAVKAKCKSRGRRRES